MSAAFMGLRIVEHPLARDIKTTFKVVRWQQQSKKRKNWRVEKVTTNKPGCWQAGNTLYVHPELMPMIRQATPEAQR